MAELAVTFSEPSNRPRTLLLTIPRARTRAPMRPGSQLTVDVGLTAVGVTLMDLKVNALCRLAACVRFRRDLAPAPSKSTPAWGIAFAPTSPFGEFPIYDKPLALLSVASSSLCRIFWFAMGATTLRCSRDYTGTVPLAAATLASARAPVVPLAPVTIDVSSTIGARSCARLGQFEIAGASSAAQDLAVSLALALSAVGAATSPVRPFGQVAMLLVVPAVIHFFKPAFARLSAVGTMLNDLSSARFFSAVAVAWLIGPMRPLAEFAILFWGRVGVLAHFHAASFSLDKTPLAGFAAFVVRTRNWPLAGT